MRRSGLTFKIIALILLTDILESVYELFFKKGMLAVGEFDFSNPAAAGGFLVNVASCGWIWIGLAIILLETFIWFMVLSKADLSVAFPVSSASYVFVLLISAFILKEAVSPNRWAGTFIIILGIFLIAKSSQKETVSQ